MNRREMKRAPVLRFKGFTNDWEQRKLKDCLEINSGRDYKHLHSGNIPVFGTGGYMLSVDEALSYKNAIGIGRKGTIDKPQLLIAPFWTVDTLFFLTPENDTDLYFLFSFFQKVNWKKYDESTGLPSLSKKTISTIKIKTPSKNEQIKIGTLIQKVNNLISLQQRKLKLLRTLKSGLSFKLFNKKHLNNLSQISLDQIGQTYSGLTGKSKKDFGHGHAFYVSYLNVNQNEIGNPKQIDRIEIDKKQNLVQKNDIFFTISSETPEEVGLTSLWPVSCKNLYLNSFCFGFRINTKMFIPLYLGYLFRSEYFREKVLPLAQGISRYNLSKNNVLKIKIGQEEIAIQEKYAKVMNDLDSDILRQKKKVKELKLCKKFLLQNMFI